MRDPADEARPHGREQRDELVVRVALMQKDGFPHVGGQLELGRERTPLRVARRVVAKEIEAALADGDERRVAEQRAQRGRRVRVEVGSVVRMHAGRREQARRAAPRKAPPLARCS